VIGRLGGRYRLPISLTRTNDALHKEIIHLIFAPVPESEAMAFVKKIAEPANTANKGGAAVNLLAAGNKRWWVM